MNTHILNGHVKTAEMEWKPLVESGVDTKGISVKPLRVDPVSGRAPTFFAPLRAWCGLSLSQPSRGRRTLRPVRKLCDRRHDDRGR
jgi:hypothetical protein